VKFAARRTRSYKGIADITECHNCDFILMVTQGRSGVSGRTTGSAARQVPMHTTPPFVARRWSSPDASGRRASNAGATAGRAAAIRHPEKQEMRRIRPLLAATDFSAPQRHAAGRLASEAGVRLALVHFARQGALDEL
jgi:hypothetical protein